MPGGGVLDGEEAVVLVGEGVVVQQAPRTINGTGTTPSLTSVPPKVGGWWTRSEDIDVVALDDPLRAQIRSGAVLHSSADDLFG